MSKLFKSPNELGLSPNDGLNRVIGFVANKIDKREFRFAVDYTHRQYTAELRRLLKEDGWKLEESTSDTSINYWKLTPIVA